MDRILMRGGTPLTGTIPIGGAKNAALPLMAASLLTAEPLVLANLPDLADITTLAHRLGEHGEAITIGDRGNGGEQRGRVHDGAARHSTPTTARHARAPPMRARRAGPGGPGLPGAPHTVIPDRVEAGAYMMGAGATGGAVGLAGGRLDHVDAVGRILEAAGVSVADSADGIEVRRRNGRLTGVD